MSKAKMLTYRYVLLSLITSDNTQYDIYPKQEKIYRRKKYIF